MGNCLPLKDMYTLILLRLVFLIQSYLKLFFHGIFIYIEHNSNKIYPRCAKDSVLFHTTVAEKCERRGIHGHYGQKPGKILEVWLLHLGDEGVRLVMLLKEEGNSCSVL